MQAWARTLTTDPRHGDRAGIASLYAAGLSDAAIVALAQLVAFVAYQLRVVAGLRAMAEPGVVLPVVPASDQAAAGTTPAAAPAPLIRHNGFTNETLGWRSWLQPLAIEDATPLQLAVLDESHAQARSSAYYRTLVHQPWMLRHRSAAYNAIMYAPGGAPRHERELAAMAVSVTNGCVYCTSVHAQRYAQLARRHDTVEQVFSDTASAGSTPREQAVVTFARALTQRPAALHQADIAPLRAQGLADDQILDVLQAAAIFGWANRLMHNLGEPVAPDAA
ncbi:MAG: peroxidase-related enzyme [Aquabacterium sp.]